MTGAPHPRGLRWAEGLYRRLLILLPARFRAAYGSDATDVFRDCYRAAHDRSGWPGTLRVTRQAVIQLLLCAVRERIAPRPRRRIHPTSRRASAMLVTAVHHVIQDIRYAMRSYIRKPSFSLTGIVIVAVGVGATTAIFSVVDGVLLKKLPYPDADRLMVFDHGSHSPLDFMAWRDRTTSFSAMVAGWGRDVDLTGSDQPERLRGALITQGFLQVLGAVPHLGRLPAEADHHRQARTAVLSHGAWQRLWGADPNIVGTRITIDGEPVLVAGVVEPRFASPHSVVGGNVDVWLPMDLGEAQWNNWGLHVLEVIGRLRPGVTRQSAQAELDVLAEAIATENPEWRRSPNGTPQTIAILPLMDATVGDIGPTLYTLIGAVGLMLLIACANLANLFLARGADRTREIALRAALGAGRRRIVFQLLTESVTLAVAGGAVGIGLAYAGVTAFKHFDPGSIPRVDVVSIDLRVMVFALLLSMVTGMVFGIMPALRAARFDVNEALKDGAGGLGVSRDPLNLRGALVVAEVSLALILLVGSGLLFHSFLRLHRVDIGIRTEQLVTLPLNLGPTLTNEQRLQFADALIDRVATIPGVDDVAGGVLLPFEFHGGNRCCWRTRLHPIPEIDTEERILSIVHPVTPGFFRVLGAQLLQGRELADADHTAIPTPAVINQEIAREMFGDGPYLGRSFRIGDGELTVVGLTSDIRFWGHTDEVGAQVYVPHARYAGSFRRLRLAVKTEMDAALAASRLREAVWALDPNLPVDDVITMRRLVSAAVATPRFFTLLLGAFATVAIVLAAGGIYGSLLYSVGQRQREVGIRMAIGARAGDVQRLFVTHGLLLSFIGIGLGLIGAVSLSHVLDTMVFGITTTDPVTLAGVSLLLTAVAAVACYLPARRAARTDPMVTLRGD